MYPKVDLEILEQRKAALRTRIRVRRAACAIEIDRVLRPAVWLEGAYAKWKAISPLVKVGAIPLGLLLKNKLFPRSGGLISGLVRWGPTAFNLLRAMR